MNTKVLTTAGDLWDSGLPSLALLNGILLLALSTNLTGAQGVVTHCGGYVNGSHGVIQTPGFPVRFPTPISCQWLIHAPPGKKIVLYFTQYYMRESFKLTEYDYYQDAETFRGKHDLGEISFEDEVISYTVYKPYLMLKFQVQTIGNIHLRVFDFLLDVYGFNITYEIVEDRAPVRTNACSVFKCSFLGNCLATKNFESYKCHCFPGFFGEDCQYGPYCNPDKGINMCWNGGKCRYFFGSLVNTCECQPGYYGVLCEKEQEDFGNTECEKIGCNQKCVLDESTVTYKCVCSEGYRLMEDNKTCLEKGRMRYNVKTRCSLSGKDDIDTVESLLKTCPDFKSQFADRITNRLFPSLKEFDNFSVVNISLGDKKTVYMEVIFIGEKVDSKQARKGMYDVINSGDICSCRLDSNFMDFDAKPALHMLTLENYDDKPILVGHLFTLVCRAKGSSALQFKWFKDRSPVHIHRTSRNMWITTIPSSDDESRMSVLNIDHAHMLDEGDFTCQVTDWDETKEKTVTVTVTPVPHVEVTPLITTLMEGEMTRCKCLSGDDERGDFEYQWWKGDQQLHSKEKTDAEVVEDLFPIGSRLTVRAGSQTEHYTCVITAPSGQANSSCQITVTKVSMDTRSCQEEEHLGVVWQQTAENQTDIKPCPRNERVLASRRCSCSSDTVCTWEEPNFSRCTSPELLRVEQELMKLQLGYMVNNVSSVLRLLQRFLVEQNSTTAKPLTGDLQLAMRILTGCQDYRRKYSFLPSSESGATERDVETRTVNELQQTINLASIILSQTRSTNLEERREMSIGQHILDLIDSIRRDPRILHAANSGPITSATIELQAQRVASSSRLENAPVYSGVHAAVTLPLSRQANTMSPNLPPRRIRSAPLYDEPFIMVTTVYENLQELLPNDSLVGSPYSINSHMVSVGPYARWDDLDAVLQNPFDFADIKFEHYGRYSPVGSHNITACLHWRSPRDTEQFGEFTTGRCKVLQSQPHSTSCRCQTPGHFIVVMTSDSTVMFGGMQKDQGVVLLIGCTLCLTAMVAALIVHLCFWRYMNDNLKVITLNFCIFVIALDCILLATFSYKQTLVLCRTGILAIAVCFIGVLTFITLELFHIRFTTLKGKLILSPLKLCLIGWGVVLCVLVAIVSCGQLIGYSDMVGRYCWLVIGTWELYAFLAPATIVLCVYIWLVALLIHDITCQEQVPPHKERRKYIFYVCRSVVLQIYILLCGGMSVAVVNSPELIYEYVFSIAIAVLGVIFFAFHCVVMVKVRPDNLVSMKELAERYGTLLGPCLGQARSLLQKNCNTEMPSVESTGSFKAFLKPAHDSKGSGTAETTVACGEDVQVIDPYPRDKKVYSKERKEQLRALLGTSSESGSSSKESDPRELLRRAMSDPSSSSDLGDTLPPNYRTITEYLADLQKQQQCHTPSKSVSGSAEGRRSLGRENHNTLCNCGTCGSTMPFKPARGRCYILTDSGGGETDSGGLLSAARAKCTGSRSSIDSKGSGGGISPSGRQPEQPQENKDTNSVPNPFPDIGASRDSLAGSSSSPSDLAPVLEEGIPKEGWLGDGEEREPLDSPLSCQLEPVMSYVLTGPSESPKPKERLGRDSKGPSTKKSSKDRQSRA